MTMNDATPSPVRFLWAGAAIALLGACATAPSGEPSDPGTTVGRPAPFEPDAAVPLTTRDQLIEALAGRPLHLVHPDVEAELTFQDGTLEGSLVRPGGTAVPVALVWEWVDGAFCRTGTIGSEESDRQCESVTLYPGVGIELDYLTSDDPNEFWVFDENSLDAPRPAS